MKKIWKWILGILIVLVVVAALAAVPFIMRRNMLANAPAASAPAGNPPQARGWNGGPMMRGFENQPDQGFQHPQVPGFNGQRGPMMGAGRGGFNRGFSPFGLGFMFLGGLLRLIPLVLFGLLLFGVYQLGKRAGMRAIAVPAPSQPAPVPPSQPERSVADENNLPPAA